VSERVLLTGGTGFIGGRLAERWAAEGVALRCLVRPGSDTARLQELGVELVAGDLRRPSSLATAVEGCELLVHCAALVSDWATVAEIRDANVTGTGNLLAAARIGGARRFVHLSSTDVYGHQGRPGRDRKEIDEACRPARFANWYAQTKLEAEQLVEVASASGLETVILRPATVYGPGSKEVVGEIARALRAGHMLLIGRGRTVAGLCQVENLIDAIAIVRSHPTAAGEAFNISDGLPVSWREFTDDLAAGLGCPGARWSIPYGAAAALGLGLEQGYRLLRRTTGLTVAPLLSRQAVQVLGLDQSFSNRRARELLGWQPRVGYQEGLEQTVRWLRSAPF
jgi:nucleoside-diphosphate-sugar epimerase